MGDRIGDWLCMASGTAFYPLDPRPEEILIDDIAHALALLCRFGGHCRTFYSVAEHSIRGTRALRERGASKRLQRAFLLHDASEAYVVDLPRPIKRMLPQYGDMEKLVERAIYDRFDVLHEPEDVATVKHMDEVMLATEKRDLMPAQSKAWASLPDPLPERITPWPWESARSSFLAEWSRLAP